MALKTRHNKKMEPNMSSMSDLVFLLLIFFVITSTLVRPNIISVNLPSSDTGQAQVRQTLTVYIDSLHNYHVNPPSDGSPHPITRDLDSLGTQLYAAMEAEVVENEEQRTVILRSDRDVPVQAMVDLMGVISALNKERQAQNKTMYKMALATVPAE